MDTSGRWAILTMIVVAAAAAIFSWTYRRRSVERAMQFWGPEAAEAIARSRRVELMRLDAPDGGSPADDQEAIAVPGGWCRVVARRDISRARGLSHLRHALLADASYAWHAPPPADRIVWNYALHFGTDRGGVDVLVDLAARRVGRTTTGRSVSIRPMGDGVEVFFEEQFAGRPSPAAGPPLDPRPED